MAAETSEPTRATLSPVPISLIETGKPPSARQVGRVAGSPQLRAVSPNAVGAGEQLHVEPDTP
jgi:hypothetical protein